MKLLGLIVKVDYNTTFEVRLRVPLPVIDWRGCSILLFRYNTGRKRIEWEVWRWISTPRAGQGSKPRPRPWLAALVSKAKIWPRNLIRPRNLTLWSLFHWSGYYPLITIGLYMCCNRVLPPTLQYNKYVTTSQFQQGKIRLTSCGVLNWIRHCDMSFCFWTVTKIGQLTRVCCNACWLSPLGLFPVWCNVMKRCDYAGDFWLKNFWNFMMKIGVIFFILSPHQVWKCTVIV